MANARSWKKSLRLGERWLRRRITSARYTTLTADLPPCARRRVHDYIAAHLDQKITNDALAQIAVLSTAHFYTVFKQTEGMSPHRYVLQCRVRRTQQLLTSTEMSLAEIADAVGFSNQSHCIQSFRKIVGVTPGDYRRCCLQGSGHSDGAPQRS